MDKRGYQLGQVMKNLQIGKVKSYKYKNLNLLPHKEVVPEYNLW